MADRGKEGGLIYQKRGLVYRVLDERGNKIGVPIKASSIYNKPTLEYLEKRFTENQILKQEFRKSLKTSIDWIMVKPPKNLEAFKSALEKEKISLVVRQNENGIVYGLTYIDLNTKCVFNGSDIGKDYSAKAILDKCGISQTINLSEKTADANFLESNFLEQTRDTEKQNDIELMDIIEGIAKPSEELQYVPYELRKRKRKRKKSN
jgi:hypothetical protein